MASLYFTSSLFSWREEIHVIPSQRLAQMRLWQKASARKGRLPPRPQHAGRTAGQKSLNAVLRGGHKRRLLQWCLCSAHSAYWLQDVHFILQQKLNYTCSFLDGQEMESDQEAEGRCTESVFPISVHSTIFHNLRRTRAGNSNSDTARPFINSVIKKRDAGFKFPY